jgi:hypothetical protein
MVVPLLESLASNGGSFLFSPYQDRGSESGRELTEEFIQPMHRAPLNLGILIGGIGFSTGSTDKFVHFFLNS